MTTHEQRPHGRALELAASAIDTTLTRAEISELELHLAACPACAREATTLRADAAALRARPALLPSSRVDQAVFGAIARPRTPPQRYLLLAGATLLLLALLATVAVGAAFLRSRDGLPSTIAPPDPVALLQPSPDGSPTPPSDTASPLVTAVDPSAAPTAEPSPTVTPAPESTPTTAPTPTSAPTQGPTAAPVLVPTVGLRIDGSSDELAHPITRGASVDVGLKLVTHDLDASRCVVTHRVVPDKPEVKGSTVRLPPIATQTIALIDGRHTFSASCPSSQGVLEATLKTIATDGQPERCKGFAFQESPISISTFDELNSGIIGTWDGCVTTPWLPAYFVSVTFRDDGTYSATSTEVLDGQEMVAMYYGTDAESPSKVYAINDIQASNKGIGQIDVFFDVGTVVRDELRNIRLMGDKLEFEVFHFGRYGPLTFQLDRRP
jgi:hypothetical protein